MMRFLASLLAAASLLLTSACSDSTEKEGPLVLAAASLQDALTEAADAWTAEGHPKPVLSFAATSALARQIESGAPADLFVSADEKWMDELSAKDAIRKETRTSFLANRLVLIAPAESSLEIAIAPGFALADALGNERLAMADPDGVPAGRYGRQALANMGVWDSVKDKIVPAENVRVALALVARKETALGIVYATDAKAEPGVRVVDTFPADSHTPISYPLAILKTSQHPAAEQFRQFLLSDEAALIFRKYGFEPRSGT